MKNHHINTNIPKTRLVLYDYGKIYYCLIKGIQSIFLFRDLKQDYMKST
jgi:hypothetical protein